MDPMSAIRDLGAQALGNVETALLTIHDYRNAAASLAGSKEAASLIGKLTGDVLSSGQAPLSSDSSDRTMRVKFNPSQLTLNASAIPQNKKSAEGPGSRTISAEQAKLNLTVVLFFDDCDTYDAFLWDKYVNSLGTAGGLANAGKSLWSAAGQRNAPSVQPEVEALVAALRNPYTRLITFRWNKFQFSGTLNTIQARYTMFSSSGRPIRAQVLLRILHSMDPQLLDGWYKSFETAFGGDTADLVRAGQRVGNLLNLNL